ncbi:MAG: serine/threonine-protein phosphatase [Firmicutes bacterium]|jgi:hypothetical protein|nr:serine/threonine-protein phosphatase [Bacillota bacterium]
MRKLHVEAAAASLSKHGEQLCGDHVEIARTEDSVIAVLSDGLGSGVKANILAMLTTRIAVTMLKGGAEIDDVVDTITRTLPICQVRKVAYSTFAIVQVFRDGRAYLVEYDTPDAFHVTGGQVRKVETARRTVADKVVREANFTLEPGDHLFLVSDGVIYAGIGGILNLGWQWPNVADYIGRITPRGAQDAALLAGWIVDVCDQFYAGKPGDDASVVVIAVREPRRVTVAVGPPKNPEDDGKMVENLVRAPGKKVVCGGTTGKIVARETGHELQVELESMDRGVPPTAKLHGMDLVTEGIITLSRTLERLSDFQKHGRATGSLGGEDGASRLARILMDADRVDFIVGQAVNPAHQNPDLPISTTLKGQVLDEIRAILEGAGKETSTVYY